MPNGVTLQERASAMLFSDVIKNYSLTANVATTINIPSISSIRTAKFAYISANQPIWVKPVMLGSPLGSPAAPSAEIPAGSPAGSPLVVEDGSVLIPANTPQLRGVWRYSYLSVISSANTLISIEWFDAARAFAKNYFKG